MSPRFHQQTTRAPTYTHTHTNTHTHIHTHKHKHTHAYTHTHTNTHKHAHAYTHIHAHTKLLTEWRSGEIFCCLAFFCTPTSLFHWHKPWTLHSTTQRKLSCVIEIQYWAFDNTVLHLQNKKNTMIQRKTLSNVLVCMYMKPSHHCVCVCVCVRGCPGGLLCDVGALVVCWNGLITQRTPVRSQGRREISVHQKSTSIVRWLNVTFWDYRLLADKSTKLCM